uniref:Uncharacterized protein n=1 Tax=Timema bartmani TaxID=61472 RepID=A0A7R9F4H2_9NEOP|nr:unnamed protein product [Timema bartmani]
MLYVMSQPGKFGMCVVIDVWVIGLFCKIGGNVQSMALGTPSATFDKMLASLLRAGACRRILSGRPFGVECVPQERGYIEFCDSTYHTIRATELLIHERIEESYLCDMTCSVYNFRKGDVVAVLPRALPPNTTLHNAIATTHTPKHHVDNNSVFVPTGRCIPARYVFLIVSVLGALTTSIMRSSMSVAIVAMVKATNTTTTTTNSSLHTDTDTCPGQEVATSASGSKEGNLQTDHEPPNKMVKMTEEPEK